LMTFPSPGIPASVNRHVPFFYFRLPRQC
jgi:hypothetical protein